MSKNPKMQFTAVRNNFQDEMVGAILTCNHNEELMSQKSFFQALRAAVTQWVIETEEGKEQWKSSCEDFNFGDLSLNCDQPSLQKMLEQHGIVDLSIRQFSANATTMNYDTIIPDANQIRFS